MRTENSTLLGRSGVSFSPVPFTPGDALLGGGLSFTLYHGFAILLPRLFQRVSSPVGHVVSAWILPLCLALPVWLIVRQKGFSLVTAFCLHRSAWPRSVLIALAVTLVLRPLSRLLFDLNMTLARIAPLPSPPLYTFDLFVFRNSPSAFFLLLLSALVAAPFAEELFFRGLLFPSLRSFLSTPCALLFTSAFFAWVHKQPMDSFSLTLSAIGFTAAALWARSLAAGFLVHAFGNVFAVMSAFAFTIPPN